MLRAFQQPCEQAVHRFDGTVAVQRGGLACFGYPVAHEDAARRAAGRPRPPGHQALRRRSAADKGWS